MVSQATERRLSDSISYRLYKLLRTHNFPITEEALLFSFTDGLRKIGFNAELNDQSKSVNIDANFFSNKVGEVFSYQTDIPYDRIIRGNRDMPPGSVTCVDQATKNFFSLVRKEISLNSRKKSTLLKDIERLYVEVFQIIDTSIREQVDERKDAILLNRLLNRSTESHKSPLIEQLFGNYPLEVYEMALEEDRTNDLNGLNRLIYNNWSVFNRENVPSVDNFEKFFWGAYLYHLRRIKGYEVCVNPKDRDFFRQILQMGEYAFIKGEKFSWGVLPSNTRN